MPATRLGSAFTTANASPGGVTSVSGTANQITVTPTTGAVVVSLPAYVQLTGEIEIDATNASVKALVLKGNVANAFPTTGAIDYWKFDENTGTSVADSIGVNNGTWQGTLGSQWTTGIINSGGNFISASTNRVLVSSSKILASLTNASISLWIKTSTTAKALYCERGAAGNDIWKVEIDSNHIRFTHRDDAGTLNQLNGGITVTDGNWHHIVLTKSGTTINSYVDGVLDITNQTLTGNNTMTDSIIVRIGGDAQDATQYYNGVLDEVGLWNIVLTAAQVTALYNAGAALAYNSLVNANLIEIQNSTGAVFLSTDPNAQTLTLTANTDQTLEIIKMLSTQSTDAFQIQNSAGTVITRISPRGFFATNALNKTNIFTIKAGTNFAGSGTTTVNGSNTTVTGVGTKFLTELGVGDQFSLSSNAGQFVTVGAIASDTSLTLATGEPSIGNGTTQTFTMQKALFGMQDSSGNNKIIVQASGFMGIAGKVNPDVALSMGGDIRLNAHALFLDTDNNEQILKSSSINGAGTQFNSFGGFQFQTFSGGTVSQLWIDVTKGVGIGTIISPTARLNIQAGTATAGTSPLKLVSGTILTTPEVGAHEYNGNFYLTKVGPVRYSVPGTLFDHYADVSNTNTAETDLYTDTLLANTLATTGDKIVANYALNIASVVSSTEEVKIYFAGTVIFDSGALSISIAASWCFSVLIIMTSSTTARAVVSLAAPGVSTGDVTETDLTGLTLSGTNILKVTGQAGGVAGASSQITAKLGSVFFYPAI